MGKYQVPKLWPGETVVCIASGPSLTPEDVNFVRGKARVIVVNTTYKLAPWADVLYACDDRWWRWERGAPTFTGLKFALTKRSAEWPGVRVLQKTGIEGLEVNPVALRTGANGGYQAMNLAVHLGAARIVLLGYDMQTGDRGREHWHEDHPNRSTSPYATFVRYFGSIVEPLRALNIEVVNCTRETALRCFPRRSLVEAFAPQAVEVSA